MKRQRKGGRARAWIAVLTLLTAGSTLLLGVGRAQEEGSDSIAAGVRIDGMALEGKTQAEAARALHDLAERKLLTPILLHAGKLLVKTNARELGVRCDTQAALAAALAAGRSQNLIERVRERVQTASAGSELEMPVTFEASELAGRLRRLARRSVRPPVEPRAREVAGKIIATAGRPGRVVDESATAARITTALAGDAWQREVAASVADGSSLLDWSARARPIPLNMVLREAAPRVTPEHVGELETLLASFTTSFSLRDRNRVHNIRLAAKAIDGVILLPGDEFSYNETVGPRRRSAGFRTAPEIVRGDLVPGIGGGVCQVSSTLYNAALLADLAITRRSHHHFPVHYLPAGRDATVSDGGLDLRFRNRLDAPVALLMSVRGSRIQARVFGAQRSKRLVQLEVQRLRPAYTKSGGRRVALIRVVRDGDELLRRETISRDSYEPAPPSAGATRRRTRRPRDGKRDVGGRREKRAAPPDAGRPIPPTGSAPAPDDTALPVSAPR